MPKIKPSDIARQIPPPSSPDELKRQAGRVVRGLRKHYADAACALNFSNPLELLIATILSAQCTDERVNIVTGPLFKKYRTAEDYAAAKQSEIERYVKTAGFFRNKAKNIKACCTMLVERHGGQVPRDLPSLVALPGVGRKTANVVLGTAFGIASGVVVDTHVKRLSFRLGLTAAIVPEKIEQELIEILPRKEWIDYSHRMIWHGRRICIARKPRCGECPFLKFCPQVGVV